MKFICRARSHTSSHQFSSSSWQTQGQICFPSPRWPEASRPLRDSGLICAGPACSFISQSSHTGASGLTRESVKCSCACTHVRTPSVNRWCKRKVKTPSSFVICLYCPRAGCWVETLWSEKTEEGIMPGKCLYLFLSHLRSGINELREIRRTAFLNNFVFIIV